MQRHARHGLVAAALAAVVAVPTAGWYATRPPAGSSSPGAAVALSAAPTSPPPGVVNPASPSPAPRTAAPSPAASHPRPTSRATARPAVVRASRPAPRPVAFRFPVPVSVGNARQVITVRASGSYASVAGWELRGSSWHLVLQTAHARVGTNGVVPGSTRVQGSGTTPGGTYTLTQAFGIAANPGTAMPFHQVTSDDWWVEDNNSAYYNQMRTASQGGFDTTLPSSATNGSEHLITYTGQYQYAVVIDFNRWPAVRYRGAGMFLHVNGSGSTAGCVSVPASTLVAIMRWLNPTAHPRIAIA